MIQSEAKSFKKDGEYIHIYTDEQGKDCLISIPVWMFNQMVEVFFEVKVKK